MNSVYFWISILAAGISLYALVWFIMRPAMHKTTRQSGVGQWLLTAAWPWVMALTPVVAPFISWRVRRRLGSRIAMAGLDDQGLLPAHIVAMQALILMASVCGLVGLLMAYTELAIRHTLFFGVAGGLIAMWWPYLWLRDLGVQRQRAMLREFPFLLDMTTLCVEAGLNLQGALQQAALHGPNGPLRAELRRALADMRAGVQRMQALRDLATRTDLPAIRSLVTALAQADQLGMSLGPLLRAQSQQRRSERFLRAEKLALEAPVKMLFPMVCCIFPCTFLVIGFPIAIKLIGTGL
ncbi:MAG: type II secretion system F family protein [Burkholderiaceae bacterium]|nr:type II secretion system F family protein [Burkholderiaceae bacterium]